MFSALARRIGNYRQFLRKEFSEYPASLAEHLEVLLLCKNTMALKMMHPEVRRSRTYIPVTLFARRMQEYGARTSTFFRSKFTQQLWLERHFPNHAPPTHHYIGRLGLLPFNGDLDGRPLDELPKLVKQRSGLFLKPSDGGHAIGAAHLVYGEDGLKLNGIPISEGDLVRLAYEQWQGYIVSDIIRNSDWARRFYDRTLSTFRNLTGIRRDTRQAYILSAIFKMGIDATFPADNWQRGLGGVIAKVDLRTGALGPLVTFDRATRRRRELSCHPESGFKVEGEVVPDWPALTRLVLAMTERFPFSGLIGWDIAHTPNGFVVVEANGSPGIDIHEVHESLLATEEQRAVLAGMNVYPLGARRRSRRRQSGVSLA